MARLLAGTAAVVVLTALAGVPAWSLQPDRALLRVSLITVARPDDDLTLIADARRGLERAQTDFAGRVSTTWFPLQARVSDARAVWQEGPSMIDALRRAAGSSDLVVAWGDLFTDAVITIAPEYPRVRFIIEDPIPLKQYPANIVANGVWDGEPAFIAGAIAALSTRSGRIGYLGPVPGWQDNAFRAGAYYASPRVQTFVDYIATTITAAGGAARLPLSWRLSPGAGTSEAGYHDARKAEEVALAQFDRGADVVYDPVGASDAGTYRAALLRERWVIEPGGPRSLSRLPEAWQNRNLAMIVSRGDVIVHHMIARVLNGLPLRQQFEWRIEDPSLPAQVIEVTPGGGPLIGNPARLTRIIDDLREGKIDVPYSREGLGAFLKRYSR